MYKPDLRPRLPAEWEPQSGVVVAWPHPDSDWAGNYADIERCYQDIASAITRHETLLVACRDEALLREVEEQCAAQGIAAERLRLVQVPYNDTWLRDTGPVCVYRNSHAEVLSFQFNAWGGRYECAHDALLTGTLHRSGCLGATPYQAVPLVLEGGSIETDGERTLLTTESCLLSPSRNPGLNRMDIENRLKESLGFDRILWISQGHIEGDDTDGHIDTLARFCDSRTIAHSACQDPSDPHWPSLQALERQLRALRTATGAPYRLIALPLPTRVLDASGRRLPANYANFLIVNGAVLVPAYGDAPADTLARKRIAEAFPDRAVIAIDCRALVAQNGSLHCMSMQIPQRLNL